MSTGKAKSSLPWVIGGLIALLVVIGIVVGVLWSKNSGSQESSACSTNTQCKDPANPVCRAGVCGPRCRNTADCTGTDVCQNGTCVAPGCSTNTECKDPANPVCRSGVCGPVCRNTQDCTGTDVCQNGTCVTPVGCSNNSECKDPNNPVCRSGVCGPTCRNDTDCTSPYTCVNGNCVPPANLPCANDNACIPPNICNNGVCVPPECTAHTGCSGTGQMCEGNRCVNIEPCSNNGRTNDAQCSTGRFCRNGACARACINDAACPRGTKCRGGVCLQPCTGMLPYECPFDHSCTDGVCVKTACSASNPCNSNPWDPNTVDLKCNNGVCEPACNLTTDCPPNAGQDCRFGYCYKQNCPRFKVYDNGCQLMFESLPHVPTPGINRDPFLMFEGPVANSDACLELCEKSRDCRLAFTGKAPTGESTCTIWARGVNLATVPTLDPDSQTHGRRF
jgi:hypothetical protein